MNRRGFTIVELLVIIVIIGVLASLIIISFSGVSDRATISSINTDLTNAKKSLLAYQAQDPNESFPNRIICPTVLATDICIKASGSGTFSYSANNLTKPASFTLTESVGSYNYMISDSSANPTLAPVNSSIVLNLDVQNINSYSGTGTSWNDLSGKNNHGTFTAAPIYSSSNSGGINFNATYWVNFSNSSDFWFLNTSQYTLEAWVRPNVNPGAGYWAGIINRESSAQTGFREGYNLWFTGISGTSDTIYSSERFTAGTPKTATTPALNQSQTVNNWVQLLITYDGNNMILYRNGSVSGTNTGATGNIINNTQTLTVGSRAGGNAFNGIISVVRIYNKALSASEVSQNFNALRGRYGL